MNMMHTIKDWTSEHRLHTDANELRVMMTRLIHNPSFWLVIMLLVFMTSMIIIGYFAISNNTSTNVPLFPTTGWPYFHPM